jgi:hypothetical protein
VCKWALCTTTSFLLCYCMGCIRHVGVLGQQSMVAKRGRASFTRALGVSQILVLQQAGLAAPRTFLTRTDGGVFTPGSAGR